jgi:anti-anti-sigma regulatory factor
MAIAVQPESQAQIIRLDGCIDISLAAELKNTLLNLLRINSEIHIDVSKLESLDITAIQLLWAAKCKAIEARCSFQIDGPWDADLELRLRLSGLSGLRLFEEDGWNR